MGLYDREYVRGREQGFFLGGNRTAVTDLIIINAAVFLLQVLSASGQPGAPDESVVVRWLALHADVLNQPWRAYELLTYGFVHDTSSMMHICFNMFALWMFGRDVESIYGRNEFLRIYLSMVVLGGAVWLLIRYFTVPSVAWPFSEVLGASGAVVGIMVLFAMHYPHRTLLVMGFLPAPAWLVCAFCIVLDLFGVGGSVAHDVHLTGAAFAFLYRWSGCNLGTPFTGKWTRKLRSLRRPRLQLHAPKQDEPEEPVVSSADQVDRVLAKISEQGEASLTRDERRILEDASRRYQQRRR
jgi:membrane associated rhomboid family serine protease